MDSSAGRQGGVTPDQQTVPAPSALPVDERALADWRGPLLGPLLRTASVMHLVGAALVLSLAHERFHGVALAGVGVGIVAGALWRLPMLGTLRRSWAFIGALLCFQVFVCTDLGLTPGPTIIASVNVSVATLLLGRAGLLFVLLGFLASYVAGSLSTVGTAAEQAADALWRAAPPLGASWGLIVLTMGLAGLSLIDAARQVLRTVLAWFAIAGQQQALTHIAATEAHALRAKAARGRKALAEAQRLQALHHLGQGMAHRFNNVLTAMAGAVDALRHPLSPTARSEVLAELYTATQAASASTSDLLLIGRRESTATGPIDLQHALHEGRDAWARLVRPDLRLEVSLQPTPAVGMDNQQLRQLLTNLLLNAMDATPPGGTVRVATDSVVVGGVVGAGERSSGVAPPHTVDTLPPGEYATLTVSDSGPGLSHEVRARAFEPFFTTRARDSHDGLGLSVALGIARLTGGSIALFGGDDAPTPGAHIVVYLPSMTAPAQSPAGVESGRASSSSPAQSAPAAAGSVSAGGIRPTTEAGGPTWRTASASDPAMQATGGGPLPLESAARSVTGEFARPEGESGLLRSSALGPPGLPTEPSDLRAWRVSFNKRTPLHALGLFGALLAVRLLCQLAGHNGLPDGQNQPAVVQEEALWVSAGLFLCAAALVVARVPQAARLTGVILLAAVAGGLLVSLSWSYGAESYPLLLTSLGWAAVSGRRRTALVLLAAMCAVLGVVGFLRVRGVLPADAAPTRTGAPIAWLSIGALATLPLIALGWTVDSLLRFAAAGRHSLEGARNALRQALVARQEEDRLATESQEALGRSNRLEVSGRVVGGVAHDLNNVLQVVACATPLLEEAAPEEAQLLLSELDEALARAQRLVAPLGRQGLAVTTSAAPPGSGPSTNLRAHVLATAASFARALPPGVRLIVTEPTAQGAVWARIAATDFERVLLNLLANARDAVGTEGQLTLKVHAETTALRRAIVEVRDDGPGIDPDVRPHVFEPLFTTKGIGAGTGLGLYQSRLIIRGEGGDLTFSSRPGATLFTVTLPLVNEVSPPTEAPPRTLSRPSAAMRVLLVDDEPLVRSALGRGLRRAGFQIVEAADAAEAMAVLSNGERFDGLCTDAIMPGPPVMDLIRLYETLEPEGVILVCSGNLPESLAEDLARSSRVRVAHKPIRTDELARRLMGDAPADTPQRPL